MCPSVRDVSMSVCEHVRRVCDAYASVCERGHTEWSVIRYGYLYGSKVTFVYSLSPLIAR